MTPLERVDARIRRAEEFSYVETISLPANWFPKRMEVRSSITLKTSDANILATAIQSPNSIATMAAAR